ncbi:MAG: extracellular solute-binding protein [Streptosporangiales bacterium]|nr:extracellular solute-binding protein [Streptosporangiales bacterium]
MNRTTLAISGVAALSVLALASACAPGSNSGQPSKKPTSAVSTDVAKAGKVTLTVWDQEVRGGQDASIKTLNDEFQKKYPNVKIKRVSKSFTNLKDTLKLALSGKNPPDVVEANQGYGDMGAFVQAGMLLPLNSYADVYGWRQRYPKTLLDLNSFTSDGKKFGQGNLYGVSRTGEIVGVYYSKKKLKQAGLSKPATWADFTSDLAKMKGKDTLPVSMGSKGDDAYTLIHLFGVIQDRSAAKQDIVDTVFGKGGKSWDTPANKKAATTLGEWAKKGYITPGTNGTGFDQAASDFAHGKSAFLITGTWETPDLQKTMKGDLGFFAPPPTSAGAMPYTTGGEGLPWSITAKSKHPDVAAAYLDFMSNAHAADVTAQNGDLPAVSPASAKPAPGAQTDVFNAWTRLSKGNGFVPYLDYTTPTFYDTLTSQFQQLVGGKTTPDRCVGALQKDYSGFEGKR